jgi:hypothetical protein
LESEIGNQKSKIENLKWVSYENNIKFNKRLARDPAITSLGVMASWVETGRDC